MNLYYSKPISSLGLERDAEFKVSSNNQRLVTGKSDVLTSPIIQSITVEAVLEGWDAIYNANTERVNDVLMAIELKNRSKYGPRSIAIPWSERREVFYSSYGDNELGADISVKCDRPYQLRPISLSSAILYLKNSTSSGLPTMLKKVFAKVSLLSDFDTLLKREWPAILFTRTQELGKTRDTICPGIADTLNEMCVYRPLLDVQRKLPWRAALNSPSQVDDAMTRLFNKAQNSNLYMVSIDFKNYDKSIKGGLQTAAWNYIKQRFQKAYHGAIDYIAYRFKYLPVVTPDGVIYGAHGVPSGSTFTNELDSIVQYLVASTCGVIEFLDFCQIQGDDGVYITDNPEELFKCFEKYGLEVSYDKSDVSRDYAVYLQSLYHSDYTNNGKLVGVYSVYRALNRIIHLERFEDLKDEISGKDYFAIRTITILENCKHHPLHKELVEYVCKIDKYNLAYSEQGLRQYVSRIARQEGKDINFRNWQYGSDLGGINEFETVKIIRAL